MLNTSITNAIARRHDYALLEATGMTKLQLQKVQQSENFIYLAGSFIVPHFRYTNRIFALYQNIKNPRIFIL